MIYEKDQPIIGFEPEEEGPAFPNHNPLVLPKKRKAKMAPRRLAKVKRALIKYSIIALLTLAALGYGTYKINDWFNYHTIKYQNPFQVPIWVEPRYDNQPAGHEVISKAEAKEINFDGANFIAKTESDKPVTEPATRKDKTSNVSAIVATVYRLESSAGKNDSCRARGLYNGYGFAPGTCYSSHDEVTALVTAWFTKRVPTMGLAKALCSYNLGPNSNHLGDCIAQSNLYPYYRDFLNLN